MPPIRILIVDDHEPVRRGMRTLLYLLHPPMLDETGLIGALRWYLEGLVERGGIDISPQHLRRFRTPIAGDRTRHLSRCSGLTNVHRHSGASDASIHFQHAGDAVILEIRDFRKGIPEERLRLLHGVTAETGIGLAGMRERISH